MRLTKFDIEQRLLAGEGVPWKDPNGKQMEIRLDKPEQRRLFALLLNTSVREPKGLPNAFIEALEKAFDESTDPKTTAIRNLAAPSTSGRWRLKTISTSGFGGLNTWKGSPFKFDFDLESVLLEGPNGSGKSSLIGAILWALTGERPRDHSKAQPHEEKPVFSDDEKPAGNWPPVACYPPTIADLKAQPSVHVQLTFEDETGRTALVERKLENGIVATNVDEAFTIAPILLETGLLMPVRLGQLRLDEGRGQLTDAVQLLTGLDDLVAIGQLADGLTHGGREYRTYKSKELAASRGAFERELNTARTVLAPVNVDVPSFQPADTDDTNGRMAVFGKSLMERASELAKVVSTDLAPSLDLSALKTQNQVITNIGNAERDIAAGIEGLSSWRQFERIAQALNPAAIDKLRAATSEARKDGADAIGFLRETTKDSKFQLKALAARWHDQHIGGAVDQCPLCEQRLNGNPLATQLELLRSAGDAAAQSFDSNINSILTRVDEHIPATLKSFTVSHVSPREALVLDIREKFVLGENYSRCLVRIASIVEEALRTFPDGDLTKASTQQTDDPLKRLNDRIDQAEYLAAIAEWFRISTPHWKSWWEALIEGQPAPITNAAVVSDFFEPAEPKLEGLIEHITRISEALGKSEPYRKAAEAMRLAWREGVTASALEKVIAKRTAIGEALLPLKGLVGASEAVARDTINGLSQRIGALLEKTLLTEQLKFHQTQLSRKEGLVVRAEFASSIRIDATLVANTSWLRAVLWCFVFALREEAVEQLGSDSFPFMAFDDPQATFDVFHRARWAHHVANQQNGPAKLQIILTSYDENFLDLIKADGLTGRTAFIGAPGPGCDHVSILEGDAIHRAWTEAKAKNTNASGVEFLKKIRIYVEGLLKLMLRGEDPDVGKMVVGDLRNLLQTLHQKKVAPWDRPVFKATVGALDKGNTAVKYLEGSHHITGRNYGMGEAEVVYSAWQKQLRNVLERAFRAARAHRMLHGGMKALFAPPASIALPEGYQAKVRSIPLRVLGRAAAFSDGRAADAIQMTEFASDKHVMVVLGKHSAYRLSARTLEPVARPGDILITKEHGEPSPRSLVVATNEDRLLARRFELSENHSDVAVLTAQAINPREIAPPVVAHRTTLGLRKIVGILFAHDSFIPAGRNDHEICDCGGEASLSYLTSDALGLVEVDGQSAEPLALHKQYIVVRNPIAPDDAIRVLDGKPIIAEDGKGSCYFKRLRASNGDQIILESLDSGGDYPPITLASPGKAGNPLTRAWPVSGILFELPNF